MTKHNAEYRIYRNGKSKAALPSETEAFEYLKRAAISHKKAEFIIEKREVIFDSHENVQDQKRLNEFRGATQDNVIHASIHPENWDIGRE
jgi:hypothetical protein